MFLIFLEVYLPMINKKKEYEKLLHNYNSRISAQSSAARSSTSAMPNLGSGSQAVNICVSSTGPVHISVANAQAQQS